MGSSAAGAPPAGAPSEESLRIRSRWAERSLPAGFELAAVRVLLGVAGAGGIGLAGYVTYKGRDGTATAALIGACVVLVFLAAFGHQITSLKYGEVEMLLGLDPVAVDTLGRCFR